ncbi:MAG TPA: hypothetical protein VGO18_12695, partial [Steroidobacteraceae bacterium]|nr:hypothetical protein [Steroidobacteraceae bacterium]
SSIALRELFGRHWTQDTGGYAVRPTAVSHQSELWTQTIRPHTCSSDETLLIGRCVLGTIQHFPQF